MVGRVSELRHLMEWGKSARNVARAMAVNKPWSVVTKCEKTLSPMWKELKRALKRVNNREERMRDTVHKVKGIPAEELLLLDMSMVVPPDELMDAEKQKEKVPDGVEPRPFPGRGMVQTFVKRSWTEPDDPDPVPHTRAQFDKVQRVIGVLLEEFGHCQLLRDEQNRPIMPKVHPVFLETWMENRQIYHRDCSFNSLLGIHGRRESKVKEPEDVKTERDVLKDWDQTKWPFPWSADTPLDRTGMRLNVWHGFDPEIGKGSGKRKAMRAENCNATMHVPKGWVMLWRGDLVHAGGLENKAGNTLENKAGNNALRVHWYIPMKKDDIAVICNNCLDDGNTSASIDSKCGGRRLSDFLDFWDER